MSDAEFAALVATVRKIDHTVHGNGERGLDARTDRLEDDVYRDRLDGRPGLMTRVAAFEKHVAESRWQRYLMLVLILLIASGQDVPGLIGLLLKALLP